MSPKVYGAMHRMHHAHADTEKDPHSPKYSNNVIKLMVKTYHQFKGVQDKTIELKDAFYKNLPDGIGLIRCWLFLRKIVVGGCLHLILYQICNCLVDVLTNSNSCFNGASTWHHCKRSLHTKLATLIMILTTLLKT